MTLLTFLRRNEGLTQRQLAARAGLHRIAVMDIERGRVNATRAELERLALALHVAQPEDLLQQVEVTWPARQQTGSTEMVSR